LLFCRRTQKEVAMDARKRRERKERRGGWPEVLAMIVTALSLIGVAANATGGSSPRAEGGKGVVPTGYLSAPAPVVASGYADAERDVLDMQLD